jgi:NAD(P)-dependent dehydrogenase (short-subunit alcohol dehydrogenase family)
VDILINNAAVGGPSGPVWKQDVENWRRTLEINVFGQFLITRTVMQGMVERRRGRIINLASGADHLKDGFVGFSAYAASQAALCRLTENLAVEARELGISVFAISLGVVRSEMLDRTVEATVAELASGRVERLPESAKPFQRPIQLCLLMASGRADSLSGTILSVRDDIAELIGRGDEINERDFDRLRLNALET